MSSYQYHIHGYKAIGDANIRLDGITVLAGVNGSGKSTLSRWLYYLVNGANHYDEFLFEELKRNVIRRMRNVRFAFREVSSSHPSQDYTSDAVRAINRINSDDDDAPETLVEYYEKILVLFVEDLREYLTKSDSPLRKLRLQRYLGIVMEEGMDKEDFLKMFYEKERRTVRSLANSYQEKIVNRSLDSLQEIIRRQYGERDDIPQSLQFAEEGVELLSKTTIGDMFNLKRAIYIDTPMAVMESSSDNVFWNELIEMMKTPNQMPISNDKDKDKKLLEFRIRRLLGGDVKIIKNDFDTSELHYLRRDGLNIRLENTATGFKSLAYLQCLLMNDYLDGNTLLLIDEPEAHLHPQWIVEFAHLLVLLNKQLGVKVMIASHNPDMVSAIRQIAQKEEILESTRFYLASQRENSFMFDYKDLNHHIEEIFESFNIALTRIAQYGNSGL